MVILPVKPKAGSQEALRAAGNSAKRGQCGRCRSGPDLEPEEGRFASALSARSAEQGHHRHFNGCISTHDLGGGKAALAIACRPIWVHWNKFRRLTESKTCSKPIFGNTFAH